MFHLRLHLGPAAEGSVSPYHPQVINKILDFVSTSDKLDLLADFYETTLKALEEARVVPPSRSQPHSRLVPARCRPKYHPQAQRRQLFLQAKNERLWFKTNLKLCKLYLDSKEYGRMTKILRELHKSCQKEVRDGDVLASCRTPESCPQPARRRSCQAARPRGP